ncbi:ABC transporter permease, partial [Frigidibacter oleivorans]|uniref:ABC transporter permease n=1 Tax=Frigidibacter oleivorans TaxID=2487129 RepID=UPI001F17AFA7
MSARPGAPMFLRIAARELRGGLAGFRIFLTCLILGVAAIAAVATLRDGIRRGLDAQGAVLLGGDAQMEFTYRYATPEERGWIEDRASAVSEIVDFRSMAVAGEDRALTQVKGVDDAYPLVGEVALDPPVPLAEALAGDGTRPGAVLDGVLADRMGLQLGDGVRLGLTEFVLTARLLREPDAAAGGFGLGPRTLVRTADLAGSGLLEPGTLFETEYRMILPPGADLPALEAEAEAAFRDSGMSWQDRRRGAPGVERFVDRMAAFLVLVGLAGLAVGGVGIAAAVRAYLDRKTEAIAVLKALGATGGTILAAYLAQIGALALAGVAAGLTLGTAIPLLAAPLIAARLPIPVEMGLSGAALAEAAIYGLLTAAIFSLWPLSRLAEVRAAALFRDLGPGRRGRPPLPLALALVLSVAALAGAALWFSGVPQLAAGTLGGVAAALAILAAAAWVLGR